MGHSLASLYKYTSIGWPFTNGSLGSCSSLGVMSLCELFLEAVVRDAKVLARVRNSGELGELELSGEEGAGSEKVGFDGEGLEEASDVKDCDCESIGMVRKLRPRSGTRRPAAAGLGDMRYSSSGGT